MLSFWHPLDTPNVGYHSRQPINMLLSLCFSWVILYIVATKFLWCSTYYIHAKLVATQWGKNLFDFGTELYNTSFISGEFLSKFAIFKIKWNGSSKIQFFTKIWHSFWWRSLRPREVKKVSNGGSGINSHYSGSHWASVFGRFVKTSGQARSLLYHNS